MLLRLEQIRKVFNEGSSDEKVALDDINLLLDTGDFVTVIGSNGAGKSTLMNMIAGVQLPDVGTISINGENVTQQPEYKRSTLIGRVFQDPMAGTAPNMTIEENLALAYARNKKRTLRMEQVKEEEIFLDSL